MELTRCLTALTEKIRCPSCETVQALEACEVAGCPDGRVMCGKCFRVFWPVAIQTQGGLFDGDETDVSGLRESRAADGD